MGVLAVLGERPQAEPAVDAKHVQAQLQTLAPLVGQVRRVHSWRARVDDAFRAEVVVINLLPDLEADIRMTRVRDDGFTVAGVPAIDDTQRTTLVLDVTTTLVDAKSDRGHTDREPAGCIVQRLEAKKLTASSDAAVARINGGQCIACGMERDTLAFGAGLDEVIQRFAFQRRGHECEGREDLPQGHVDGLWSAPSAEKYWRKVTQVVVARQAEVTRACGACHTAWVRRSEACLKDHCHVSSRLDVVWTPRLRRMREQW